MTRMTTITKMPLQDSQCDVLDGERDRTLVSDSRKQSVMGREQYFQQKARGLPPSDATRRRKEEVCSGIGAPSAKVSEVARLKADTDACPGPPLAMCAKMLVSKTSVWVASSCRSGSCAPSKMSGAVTPRK